MQIQRLALAALACCTALACSTDTDTDTDNAGDTGTTRLVVGVAFYPIEDIVRQVGGDLIEVVTIVPPGEEAHEFEPTPRQLTDLSRAGIVFYFGRDFQPSVEQALANSDGLVAIDLLDDLTLLPDDDPHVWLSIRNMQTLAGRVAAELGARLSTNASTFTANAGAYSAELAGLDDEFATGLAECDSRYLVTGHRAFAYLARDYDLTQVAIAGISPGDEPSAKDLEQLAQQVTEYGVRTVFFEEHLSSDLARTLADETGADTGVLDNAETLSAEQLDAGANYLSIMRGNLSALRTGLGCA